MCFNLNDSDQLTDERLSDREHGTTSKQTEIKFNCDYDSFNSIKTLAQSSRLNRNDSVAGVS